MRVWHAENVHIKVDKILTKDTEPFLLASAPGPAARLQVGLLSAVAGFD